MNITEILSAGC